VTQGPQAQLAKLFLEHPEMTWPDGCRIAKEIPQRDRIRREKIGEALGTFACIATPARRDQVAARPVPASHSWPHMIDRQLRYIEHLATVDTPIIIAGEYILASHRTSPDIQFLNIR